MIHPKYEYKQIEIEWSDEQVIVYDFQKPDIKFRHFNEALNYYGSRGWILRDFIRTEDDCREYVFIRKTL